jgi:hypothetical protein
LAIEFWHEQTANRFKRSVVSIFHCPRDQIHRAAVLRLGASRDRGPDRMHDGRGQDFGVADIPEGGDQAQRGNAYAVGD